MARRNISDYRLPLARLWVMQSNWQNLSILRGALMADELDNDNLN